MVSLGPAVQGCAWPANVVCKRVPWVPVVDGPSLWVLRAVSDVLASFHVRAYVVCIFYVDCVLIFYVDRVLIFYVDCGLIFYVDCVSIFYVDCGLIFCVHLLCYFTLWRHVLLSRALPVFLLLGCSSVLLAGFPSYLLVFETSRLH